MSGQKPRRRVVDPGVLELERRLVAEFMTPSRIGILLFPGVEELDAIGPWEVLAFWTRTFPEDRFEVFCVSHDGLPVTCARGLVVAAHHSYKTMPPLTVLLHPGGKGVYPLIADQGHLAWVQQQRKLVPLLASVCTGALVYAAAGLLSGRPATTYWSALDTLAELDPSIEIRPNDRFVDAGEIITSAGVSAGIDMALHLVDRLKDTDRARDIRRGIQYDPAPPV